MFKLIFIYGIWINPMNIAYAVDYEHDCYMEFVGHYNKERLFEDVSCADIADLINKRTNEKVEK